LERYTKTADAHDVFFGLTERDKNVLGGRFRYWPFGFLRTPITTNNPIDLSLGL
jgi:hypothetical protein